MIKKLKKQLKKHLNNKNIIDIFIIGSSLKNKLDFKDIDIIILFRKKDFKDIENIIYNIKTDQNYYRILIFIILFFISNIL